jgi:hypothetical protein
MKKYVVRGKIEVLVTVVIAAASPDEARRQALRKKVEIKSGGSSHPGDWQISSWPTDPEITEVLQGG